VSLHLVQPGTGDRRIVAIAYFVADFGALRRSLPPSACILVDNANPGGRFARVPGAGGVDPLPAALATAQRLAGPFTPSAVVLIGWSAGVQAVREQLRAGARPDVALALDGTSGNVPLSAAQLDPWRDAVTRARAGACLAIFTATQQVYTRDLPAWKRFEATQYVVTELWTGERPLTPSELLPPVAPGEELRDGDLVVAVHASARFDGDAHRREQNQHMPDLLARVVVPWLAAREGTLSTDPAQPPDTLPTGAKPRDAKTLQSRLNAAGAKPPLQVDGDIGPLTRAATRAFQRDRGLPATGEAGEATWEALEASEVPFVGPPLSVGLAALERLRGEVGVHETPGPGYTARVVEYGRGAVRGGKRLDLGATDEPAWCAALQGWAERGLPGALPWRWAVSERWSDAKARGLTRPKSYRAKAGDEAIFARGGGDPRHGGTGHVARVEVDVDDGGNFPTIGGNEGGVAHHGGEVLRTQRNVRDTSLVGFIVRS